jgi:hypothetical protein
MINVRQAARENLGKWVLLNTKSGAYHGKIESVDRYGITVLVPSHYKAVNPIRTVGTDVKSKEKLSVAQYFYGYPGYGYGRCSYGACGYDRWWIPFLWLLALGVLLWW